MPELAEVELARRIWATAEGESISSITSNKDARIFRDLPAAALPALVGKTMTSSTHHGKRMYFTFDHDWHLEVHLGMSGKVYCAPPDYEERKHDHLILRTPSYTLVLNDYRMFGRVMLHEGDSPWESLPPSPLSRRFNQAHVRSIIERRPKKILKGALLDQSLFPGVGNWMADEICWRLGALPDIALGSLSPERLYEEVKFVCKGAIKHVADKNQDRIAPPEEAGFAAGGYVAQVPPTTWLFQHRWKKGGLCPTCHCELERGTIATRTTAWCPQCQTAYPKK